MSPRGLAAVVATATLAVAGAAVATRPAQPEPDRPNVLIVIWDTVRADRLSLYGHERRTTPWLDRFAEDATVFDRALSPETWTAPSHASLFTGYAPQHHGVKATYKWLDERHVTLAEHLGAHGWDTFLFSANPYVARDTNLAQGFETVGNTFHGAWKKLAREMTDHKLIRRDASTDISPSWRGKRTVGDVHHYKDAGPLAHDALIRWLENRDADGPWLAVLNLMEAHTPRIPSLDSRQALLDTDTIERGLATSVSQIELLAYTFGRKDYSDDELEAIRGVYDATLRDLDLATAALFDDLDRRGLLDDTIVVLTSDHGENLGDHHMFGHKFSVWDTLLHVPLVIRAPGRLPTGRVATPVSNLAVFATILELAGVPLPTPGPDVPTSLLRATAGPVVSELVESTPMSISRIDREYGLFDKSWWLRTMQAVEEDGWKLVVASDGSEELYDVRRDPGETVDHAADRPDTVEHLRGRLAGWNHAIPDYDAGARAAVDQPPELDPKARKMLAALGYLEEDGAPAGVASMPDTDPPDTDGSF